MPKVNKNVSVDGSELPNQSWPRNGKSSMRTAGTTRREPVQETVDAFQIARVVFERFKDTKFDHIEPISCSLDISPALAVWNRSFYETYIGDLNGRVPRFDLDYIFSIPLGVLRVILPYLRRSDYLNELGKFTTTTTAPNSICVCYQRCGVQKGTSCDINLLSAIQQSAILAPFRGEGLGKLGLASSDGQFIMVDDVISGYSISDFTGVGKGPSYRDADKRYYNRLSSCQAGSDGIYLPVGN